MRHARIAVAAAVVVVVVAALAGCTAAPPRRSGPIVAPKIAGRATDVWASVTPSSEATDHVLVGLGSRKGANVSRRVPMGFAPDATYQVGGGAPITIARALEINPGRGADDDPVVWWANALCKVTYHTSDNGELVVDRVWASVPH